MPPSRFAGLRDNYDGEVHATWDPPVAMTATTTTTTTASTSAAAADDSEVRG